MPSCWANPTWRASAADSSALRSRSVTRSAPSTPASSSGSNSTAVSLVRSRQSRSRHRPPRRGKAPAADPNMAAGIAPLRSAVRPARNVSRRESPGLPESGRALTLGPATLRTFPNPQIDLTQIDLTQIDLTGSPASRRRPPHGVLDQRDESLLGRLPVSRITRDDRYRRIDSQRFPDVIDAMAEHAVEAVHPDDVRQATVLEEIHRGKAVGQPAGIDQHDCTDRAAHEVVPH